MAQKTMDKDKPAAAATKDKQAQTPAQKEGVPPEEQFWKRYSPHHEAPLSGAGSFAIHVLVIGFLLLWAVYLAAYFTRPAKSLPMDAVRLDLGGGGGKKTGEGDAPGIGHGPEAVAQQTQTTPTLGQEDPKRPDLKANEAPKVDLKLPEDFRREIARSNNESIKALASLDDRLRAKLSDGLNPGYGRGGEGRGGGKGSGTGTGEGSGTGEGRANLTQREKRMLRWAMVFNTNNGTDYLAQLKGLGAILAIPVKEERGQIPDYKLVRDLSKRPAVLLDEDVAKLNRIYWIDNKPQSVNDVMGVLGVKLRPSHFVAFMPPELEDRLYQIEKDYKGLKEDQIEETKFEAIRSARGYDVRVVSQTPK